MELFKYLILVIYRIKILIYGWSSNDIKIDNTFDILLQSLVVPSNVKTGSSNTWSFPLNLSILRTSKKNILLYMPFYIQIV